MSQLPPEVPPQPPDLRAILGMAKEAASSITAKPRFPHESGTLLGGSVALFLVTAITSLAGGASHPVITASSALVVAAIGFGRHLVTSSKG